MLYVPGVAVEATVSLRVEGAPGLIAVGLKLAVTPAGRLAIDKNIVELKLPFAQLVMLCVPDCPSPTNMLGIVTPSPKPITMFTGTMTL
jgi:hypothetical protein